MVGHHGNLLINLIGGLRRVRSTSKSITMQFICSKHNLLGYNLNGILCLKGIFLKMYRLKKLHQLIKSAFESEC